MKRLATFLAALTLAAGFLIAPTSHVPHAAAVACSTGWSTKTDTVRFNLNESVNGVVGSPTTGGVRYQMVYTACYKASIAEAYGLTFSTFIYDTWGNTSNVYKCLDDLAICKPDQNMSQNASGSAVFTAQIVRWRASNSIVQADCAAQPIITVTYTGGTSFKGNNWCSFTLTGGSVSYYMSFP